MAEPAELTAPYRLEYAYKRGLGPVLSAFFSGLQRGQLLGVRSKEGEVYCPPTEYHPQSAEAMSEMVPLSGLGEVRHAFWVAEPKPHHPLNDPFAFACIRLDGTSSDLVHALDTGGREDFAQPGLRVAPRWRAERSGSIADIEAFVALEQARPAKPSDAEAIDKMRIPIALDYLIRPGVTQRHFLEQLAQQRLMGRRSPVHGHVLIPPRGACTASGAGVGDEVEVSSTGTVTTFSVIHIEFPGQRLPPPYVCAAILLDGADVPLIHLVGGDPSAVRMGMRVRAVWTDEPMASMEAIRFFEPSGEPDAAFETYAGHL